MPRARPHAELESSAAAVVAAQFGGDEALYRAFAIACAAQFELDAAAGRAACEAGDLPGLRRLAHNLKSALVLLGHGDASSLAAQVEERTAAGDLPSACVSWQSLDAMLQRFRAP